MRYYPGTRRPMPRGATLADNEDGNMGAVIAEAFPLEQSAHISILLGRLLAHQTLIDMLWTNVLADTDDPFGEAEELKDKIMSLLVTNPEDSVQNEAEDELERRLDAIIKRAESL